MPPDRPPGRPDDGGPPGRQSRGDRHQDTPPPPDAEAASTLPRGGGIDSAVAGRLLDLRHRGYFTRAELAAAVGWSHRSRDTRPIRPRRGGLTCPGQFGPDGRLMRCCGPDAG